MIGHKNLNPHIQFGAPKSNFLEKRAYKIIERKAVSTDNAWSVPGTAVQPPPDKSRKNPMSVEIDSLRWVPGFEAQDAMLDAHMKTYGLESQDWRPKMYKMLKENK